jgi:hypothetical protein
MESQAIRALMVNRQIDSIMNKSTPSVWKSFESMAGKLTLQGEIAGCENFTDIEYEIAKAAIALKNPANSYNDFLTIKSSLDKTLIKLDKHIDVLGQQEALLKASELKCVTRDMIVKGTEESQLAMELKRKAVK